MIYYTTAYHYLINNTGIYTGISWEELQSQCGQSSLDIRARIVNGHDVADLTVWPWAGYLSTFYYDDFFCGAELISPQWAVTAAHCV